MQLIKIVVFFVVLVIVYFASVWVFDKFNKIEYEGLTFSKEKFGELTFYHYYYYFQGDGGLVNRYNLYLRHDPRFNNVRIDAKNPLIFNGALGQKAVVMMTVDTSSDLGQCSESFGAIGSLAGFLADNQIDIRSGVMNQVEAVLENRTHVTCDTHKNMINTYVIQITSGEDETWVNIDGRCHTITVGNDCEIMKAVEKYITQAVLDARANP